MNDARRHIAHLFAAAAALLFPLIALAHPGHEADSFMSGLSHPWGGVDHLLAMLAVGLLAGRIGRAPWLLPACFVAALSLGGVIGARGYELPLVESAIASSLIVFGTAIALRRHPPLAAAAVVTACFAVFHGYAHGAEMAADASGLAYGAGFVISSGALHALGLFIAVLAVRRESVHPHSALRLSGGAIAWSGMLLIGGMI